MSSGQAHTTWFHELKKLLQDNWTPTLTIPEQFRLLDLLNQELNSIRIERSIQPPMMWCPYCKERHRSKFLEISINALYFALKRFDISSEPEIIKLRKEWRLYSKENKVDIWGKPMENSGVEKEGRHHKG